MKKILGILVLSMVMVSTFSFAAYPADLENLETEGLEYYSTLKEEDLEAVEDENSLVEETSEEKDNEKIEHNGVLEDDVYRFDDEVIVDEMVDANVYVMGETVKVDGAVIYGNLYVMGKKVEIIDSEIDGSVYVLGENVTFSSVANDIYACASNITFDSNAYLWRNAKIGANTVKIDGTIERDVAITVNTLSVGDNAVIGGNLNYYSSNEGTISEEADIASVNFVKEEVTEEDSDSNDIISDYIYDIVSVSLRTLIVALMIVFCISKFEILKRTENLVLDLLKDTGKGAAVLVLVPILFVLLICSVIGIGIGFVLLALYLIGLYISISIVSLEITHRILNSKKDSKQGKGQMIGISILVSIVIWAISLIPVIGGIIKFVLVLIGLGILFDMIFQKNKKENVNEN